MEMQAQLDELNAGLADLIDAADTSEIGKTLSEMLDVLKARKGEVTVNVQPTPIQNFVRIERGSSRIDFNYDKQGRVVSAVVSRIKED